MKILVETHIKGLIFDLDGTLADTMPKHYLAWKKAALDFGIDFPEKLFYEWAGMPTGVVISNLGKINNTTIDEVEMGKRKDKYYFQMKLKAQPIPEIMDVVNRYQNKLPMAIGTGSNKEVAFKTLKEIGCEDIFKTVVTADDVSLFKPAPETFLLCAKKMGVEPSLCMVFEDGDPGIEAAKKANMTYVDVRDFLAANH